MALQPDYRDILAAFAEHKVEYLVVGGYAVGFHGTPRFTKDLDLWIRPSITNLERVKQALYTINTPVWDGAVDRLGCHLCMGHRVNRFIPDPFTRSPLLG